MPQRSAMSPGEFRKLRESTGLSQERWAELLECSKGAIHNMESHKPIGKQTAWLAILMAHPAVRALLPEVRRHKETVITTDENTS